MLCRVRGFICLIEPSLHVDVIRTKIPCAASTYHESENKWTSTRENLSSGFSNNKGADQLAHLRSLINAFVIKVLENIISILATCKISFYLVSVTE